MAVSLSTDFESARQSLEAHTEGVCWLLLQLDKINEDTVQVVASGVGSESLKTSLLDQTNDFSFILLRIGSVGKKPFFAFHKGKRVAPPRKSSCLVALAKIIRLLEPLESSNFVEIIEPSNITDEALSIAVRKGGVMD